MTRALAHFENAVEKLVEGAFDWLLRRRLEPVEIARRLARVMEDNQTIGAGKIFVPNLYRVGLHSETFKTFVSFKEPLEAELASYLTDEAGRQGFDFIGRPHVTLTIETGVRRGRCRVHAELAGSGSGALDPIDTTQTIHTAELRAMANAGPQAATQEKLQLMIGDRVIPLSQSLSIGRSLDNDVIVQVPSVSRRHAQIVFRHGRWLLRDLQSTHGTRVNGHSIDECVLRAGDTITLGDVTVQVQAAPGPALDEEQPGAQ
jgi:hypothetical protein